MGHTTGSGHAHGWCPLVGELLSMCLTVTETPPSLHWPLLTTPADCSAAEPGAGAVLSSLPLPTLAMSSVHSESL